MPTPEKQPLPPQPGQGPGATGLNHQDKTWDGGSKYIGLPQMPHQNHCQEGRSPDRAIKDDRRSASPLPPAPHPRTPQPPGSPQPPSPRINLALWSVIPVENTIERLRTMGKCTTIIRVIHTRQTKGHPFLGIGNGQPWMTIGLQGKATTGTLGHPASH